MIGKIVVGFLVFCLTLVCIFSFDSAFDYTYESSGLDDYVKVDMKTPTDINEQLLDQSLGRTFSFVGTVGSWVRDVWDRGITMFSYISGSFDYRVENELYFDSFELLFPPNNIHNLDLVQPLLKVSCMFFVKSLNS